MLKYVLILLLPSYLGTIKIYNITYISNTLIL